jgi:predicted RNase H-like HicB family nuclease
MISTERVEMPKKTERSATLREYVAEALKNARYETGEALDVIVAEVPDLPGCLTQGKTVEEARENLIDAIEVWVLAGLRSGEDLPIVNGHRLGITEIPRGRARGKTPSRIPTRAGT